VIFAGHRVAQHELHSAPGGPPAAPYETLRYFAGDHLGSASVVLDAAGQLVSGVRYEPYGRIREQFDNPNSSVADPLASDYDIGAAEHLFNGKPRNRKAYGLQAAGYELEGYDYGARIYLPELSRWASADAITPDLVWEANPFQYVRSNPLRYVDPDGRESADREAEVKASNAQRRQATMRQILDDADGAPEQTRRVYLNNAKYEQAAATAAVNRGTDGVLGWLATALQFLPSRGRRVRPRGRTLPKGMPGAIAARVAGFPDAVDAKTWQQYEEAVSRLWGGRSSHRERMFTTVVDGELAEGVADNVAKLGRLRVAVEAKFVQRAGWGSSLRNPGSGIADAPFAMRSARRC